MNKFSNILKIPASFDLYKEMANKIALKIKSIDPSSDVPMFGATERRLEDLMFVESATNFGVEAIYDHSKFSVKTLNELSDTDDIFVLHLNVLQVNPSTIYEYVCLLCSNCNMSSHTKDVEDLTADNKYTCGFCKTQQTGKLYYNVQLVCRENYFSNKLISIYLSTFDNQGNGFFSIPAADFYRNSNEYQKLKQNVESLIKPEVYISVLVQAIKTEHSESDRVYRIIGEYQNKLN